MTSWLGKLAFFINKLGLQCFEFILQSLNLNGMGLKHLSFINNVFLLLSILIGITFGGEKP